MIEQDNTLSPFEVSFSERLARIVLSPRDLDAVMHNYFLFMSVIVLLDEIFVKLFEIYLEKMK